MKQKPRGRVTGGDGDTVCKKNIFQFANFGQVLFVLVFKKKSHTDQRLHLNSKGYFLFYLFQFANFGQVSVGTYYQKEVIR